MNAATRLAVYAASVTAVFGAAAGVGAAVGPVLDPTADTSEQSGSAHTSTASTETSGGGAGHEDHRSGTGAAAAPAGGTEVPGGLLVAQDGYTFDLGTREAPAASATPVAFRILGPDGQPVTEYQRNHDRDLHLIAVRRDTTGFQHVHPDLDADGTWTAALDLTPGQWRLFADFVPAGGEALTLGADLAVAGSYDPAPSPAASTTAQVDGYTVTLDGTLVPGEASPVTLTVSRGGEPVTDLQPYLGSYGHLVALRGGDLAYLHVHPTGEPGDGSTDPGPQIAFVAEVPSAGTYRLFLDFQHDGVVRTAEFTLGAGPATGTAAEAVGTSPAGTSPSSTPASTPASTEHEDTGSHAH